MSDYERILAMESTWEIAGPAFVLDRLKRARRAEYCARRDGTGTLSDEELNALSRRIHTYEVFMDSPSARQPVQI